MTKFSSILINTSFSVSYGPEERVQWRLFPAVSTSSRGRCRHRLTRPDTPLWGGEQVVDVLVGLTPRTLAGRYQAFGETYCCLVQGWKWIEYVSLILPTLQGHWIVTLHWNGDSNNGRNVVNTAHMYTVPYQKKNQDSLPSREIPCVIFSC